ncbi:putative ribonuclease H-like domain-containing protein [Tanacetum coccineum]
MTHPHLKRSFVPQVVLTKTGKINIAGANVNTAGVAVNTVRPVNTANIKAVNTVRSVNTAASKPIVNHPRTKTNAFKRGYSQRSRPFNRLFANKNNIVNKNINIVWVKNTTARDRAVVIKNKEKGANAGIKREFSVARNPQQNGVAKRRNRTLIEAARTMLVDSKLPTTFWAEAVNTACYVLNRVLVIKPYNKTPYKLIRGRTPLIDFMKPFGYPVTILNTRDHLGRFDGKANEGFFVGYSVVSKAMRVFNKRTRIVEETLNIRFLENAPNVTGNGPDWLFDVDSLSKSMNYVPVIAENQTNGIAGKRDNIVAGQAEKKIEPEQEYILIPICTTDPLISQDPKVSEEDAEEKTTEMDESGASDKDGEDDQATRSEFERLLQQEKQTVHTNSTNSINTVSTPVSTAGPSCTDDDLSSPVNAAEASNAFEEHLFEQFSPFKNAFTLPPVSNVTPMNDTGIFGNAYDDEDVGAEADLNNLETTMNVSPIPTTRIDKDHPKDQIIGDLNSAIQTRRMTKISDEHAMVEKALYGLHQAPRACNYKKQTIVTNSTTEAEYVAAAHCCGQAKHIEYLVGDEAVHKELGDKMERAATTASSLEAEQDSDRVLALETDLQQTKKVYCTTVTKLIMMVKRLEKIVKSSKARRRAKIVVSDDEEVLEDSSKQGRMIDDIYQDAGITLLLLQR